MAWKKTWTRRENIFGKGQTQVPKKPRNCFQTANNTTQKRMSQPDNQSNTVTCSCQHCNGHIKFGADQLRKGETRRIECPHCHLETSIFHPHTGDKASPPAEKINPKREESSNSNPIGKQPQSTKAELYIFSLVRYGTLAGAVLVLTAFIIVAVLAVITLIPEKPQPPQSIISVSYETVAPVQPKIQTSQNNQRPFVPTGANIADKNAFPQPVVDFLLAHEGFSLKMWLDKLRGEHRQAFLDNLASVLQTANTKQLTSKQLEKVVGDFADLWIFENERPPDPNAALEKQNAEMQKQIFRATCISVAFGLFITLTIFCMILVLLAVERNTRKKDTLAAQ